MRLRILFQILILSSFSFSALSQEICDNGIDDDGDGLIDLNDDDCECNGFSSTQTVPSLIPNSSFEDYSCCPTSFSQLNCADTWIQASTPTSDFWHTCGTAYPATYGSPGPNPDGNGIAGFINWNNYKEYVGACLLSPMLAGNTYILSFYLGFGSGSAPLDITFFGSPNCSDLPFNDGCPVGEGSWVQLASVTASGPGWVNLQVTFTPSVDINAFVVGPGCASGPSNINYYYVDGLTLAETSAFSSMTITESGNMCSNNLALTADIDTTGGTWQWYEDGVAIAGQTSSVLQLSANNLGAGTYQAVYSQGIKCEMQTYTVVAPDFPVADFSATTVCEGVQSNFTDLSSVASGNITSWQWDFDGDGVIDATGQNPSYTFPSDGTFNTTLYVTSNNGCVDSITSGNGSSPGYNDGDFVYVNPLPQAGFNVSNVCLGSTNTFTDASTVSSGSITGWSWDFGDSSPLGTNQNETHTYGGSGSYSVDLVVTTNNGCQGSVTQTAVVYQLPTASFVVDNVCDGIAYDFVENSVANEGTISTWDWDFTDNGSVDFSGQSASNLYGSSGTYDVSLTVTTNYGCEHTIVQPVTVYALPVPSFTSSQECEGVGTQFTDGSTSSSGTLTNWSWDFTTDGTSDNVQQNPLVVMGNSGNYTTTLTVTTSFGCVDSVTGQVVVDPLPAANFIVDSVCLNDVNTYTDASTVSSGSITGWSWDFGDSSPLGTNQNETHTYGGSGSYSVDLVVTTNNGCQGSVTQTAVVYQLPTASFVVDNVCDGIAYDFVENSVANEGTITTWDWDFTDNGSVDFSGQSASNLYGSSGTYDVSLTVTTNYGCEHTIVQPVTVYALPVPSFTSSQECEGVGTQFTDGSTSSSGTLTNWSWDFTTDGTSDNVQQNPMVVMGNSGNYTTTLTVTTSFGCVDSVTGQVVVDPLPVANFTWTDVCDGGALPMVDQSTISTGIISTYDWDFGDMAGVSSSQNPSYIFSGPGQYNVSLLVTSGFGCMDSITQEVVVFPNPLVDFVFSNKCLGTPINFNENSNIFSATSATYNWDFTSNGSVDFTGTSTDHQYAVDGSFNATLSVITSDGCTGSSTQEVIVYPLPLPSFTGQNVCEGYVVAFSNSSSVSAGSITDYFWDFANGNSSTQYSPYELFASEGIYMVTLQATTDQGCVAEITQPTEIYPTPVAQFVTNDVCDGSVVSFTDFSTVSNQNTSNAVVSWNWDFGTTPTSGTLGQFASTVYSAPGTYTVTLDVSTNNGCTNSYQSDVTIYPNPVVSFVSPNPEGCAEWCPIINNTSTISSGTNNSFFWNLGDGTASTDEHPVHCFSNATLTNQSYDVTLTVTSDFGCVTSLTQSSFITVFPIPVANFGNDPMDPLTVYDPTVHFVDSSLIADVYLWDFGGLGSSTESNPTFVFPEADSGTYQICLNVQTLGGCEDTLCKDITIEGYANLYIPNAFSPDGDGINDVFKPSLYGYSEEEYSFMIFDRWGMLIYETTRLNDAWDGTYLSVDCMSDVYVWKISVKDRFSGDVIKRMGHVTILR